MGIISNFLSQVGLETKRFNPLIIEQIKKYNEDLNIDIKVNYLNISKLTNPKIKLDLDPTLILGNNKIKLESIKTEIDNILFQKQFYYR